MILRADAIHVHRQRTRIVLAGVSLTLTPGRLTGIVGPNGAGKSTLLKALAGVLPVTGGRVTLDGTPLGDIDRRQRARAIAYLPQERSVHWPLPVRDIVALGRLPHRIGPAGDSAADRAAIDAALTTLDLAALADRPADQLSGGELGRALIGRALAQQASIILADEPAAGLDPAHALELFGVLSRLALEGRTVAVAHHDLSMAARFCHDVVVLDAGRVAAAGSAADVLTQACLEPVFGVRFAIGAIDGVPIVLPSMVHDAESTRGRG
jgi:iron complex transport system ATP-binding protein